MMTGLKHLALIDRLIRAVRRHYNRDQAITVCGAVSIDSVEARCEQERKNNDKVKNGFQHCVQSQRLILIPADLTVETAWRIEPGRAGSARALLAQLPCLYAVAIPANLTVKAFWFDETILLSGLLGGTSGGISAVRQIEDLRIGLGSRRLCLHESGGPRH